jgi:hypothetical protein
MYKANDAKSLERYSSAVTLSDMELFIFPEILFSAVLANIMSPNLWKWRDDTWFGKMEKQNPYRRMLRLKQYIMDHFAFNLDLDTWGLTTKDTELARFSPFIDTSVLAQSNALFGYEGDKYYFDIDIRKHFGLDKYVSDVIPYWKTETVEAMEAFRYKDGYPSGAGECVSLSTLYASALFVVAGVPLDKIYMMATPLHSQNFVDLSDGVITNNRRIVTRNMWFNGSEITAKAQRALRNERVTIVANNTGWIHTVYGEASMSRPAYEAFAGKLTEFLSTDIDFPVLASFLRDRSRLQKCFQFSHSCCGKPRYIEAEKVFGYEHNSRSRASDDSRATLMHEIDEDEFYPEPLPSRILLDELEEFFKGRALSIDCECNVDQLKQRLHHTCFSVEEVVADLLKFCRTTPRLPDPATKTWVEPKPVEIDPSWSREKIIDYVESIRTTNEAADLAFMAFRDMRRAPWKPFLKAALQRCPVSIAGAGNLDLSQTAERLRTMPNESIYDGTRMAQPDEVWNYQRGDGLEKAICLINIAKARSPESTLHLEKHGSQIAVIDEKAGRFVFESVKNLDAPGEEEFAGL